MPEQSRLRLADLRAAFRLIGECRELGGDVHAWRRHLLDGLRRLTGAQVALYLHIRHLGSDDEQIAEPLDSGFLDEAGRALWAQYQRDGAHRDDPFHIGYYRTFSGALRTRSLRSVVDLRDWEQSRHYQDYIRACGLDDRIASSVRLPQMSPPGTQVLVLHRAAADGPYPQRATRLVRLVHEELIPLLGGALRLPGTSGAEPPLPSRLEQVLECLRCGESEKQVAARLELSPHTVNRHVQRLYRRFGVHSRGELMFRLRETTPRLASERRSGGHSDNE